MSANVSPIAKPTFLLIDREPRCGIRLRQLVNLVSSLYLESVTMAKTYSPTNWLGSFTTKRCPILKAATFLIVPDGLPKAELYAETSFWHTVGSVTRVGSPAVGMLSCVRDSAHCGSRLEAMFSVQIVK
jgi:hypothetical protein